MGQHCTARAYSLVSTPSGCRCTGAAYGTRSQWCTDMPMVLSHVERPLPDELQVPRIPHGAVLVDRKWQSTKFIIDLPATTAAKFCFPTSFRWSTLFWDQSSRKGLSSHPDAIGVCADTADWVMTRCTRCLHRTMPLQRHHAVSKRQEPFDSEWRKVHCCTVQLAT